MVSLPNNVVKMAPVTEMNAEWINQNERLTSLEQELERLNQQLSQNQRYTAALEVDFEHVLHLLHQLQQPQSC